MKIDILGTGRGGMHQYVLEIRSMPAYHEGPSTLEFQHFDEEPTPNGIIIPKHPPGSLLTNSSPQFLVKVSRGGESILIANP